MATDIVYETGEPFNLPKQRYIHPDGMTELATVLEYERKLKPYGYRPIEEVAEEWRVDPKVSGVSY